MKYQFAREDRRRNVIFFAHSRSDHHYHIPRQVDVPLTVSPRVKWMMGSGYRFARH